MSCRSSWFLPDCDSAAEAPSAALSAVSAEPVDYAPRMPQARFRGDWRGVFDRATVADLEQSRRSGAGLAALDPNATSGAAPWTGSILPPLLILAALFAFSS